MKADEAAKALRQAIRQGVIGPGDELNQEQVANRLGISRIPLREALQSLAALGIVSTTGGRGFRVASLRAAHAASTADASDDALLVERNGGTVATVPGDPGNLKITFPEDLAVAEALL